MSARAFADLVAIGRVVKPQGRKGEVVADPFSDRPDRFPELRRVYVPGPGGAAREMTVTSCWPHKGRFVLKLEGVDKTGVALYTQLLGPDWDKIRLAIVGNQIVVLLGSDVKLFDAALRNLQKGDAGLAGTKRLAAFHERASKERLFEFHVSVEGVLRLVNPNLKIDNQPQLTSMALALGESSLQIDARVPMPEVRTIARKAQEEPAPK